MFSDLCRREGERERARGAARFQTRQSPPDTGGRELRGGSPPRPHEVKAPRATEREDRLRCGETEEGCSSDNLTQSHAVHSQAEVRPVRPGQGRPSPEASRRKNGKFGGILHCGDGEEGEEEAKVERKPYLSHRTTHTEHAPGSAGVLRSTDPRGVYGSCVFSYVQERNGEDACCMHHCSWHLALSHDLPKSNSLALTPFCQATMEAGIEREISERVKLNARC